MLESWHDCLLSGETLIEALRPINHTFFRLAIVRIRWGPNRSAVLRPQSTFITIMSTILVPLRIFIVAFFFNTYFSLRHQASFISLQVFLKIVFSHLFFLFNSKTLRFDTLKLILFSYAMAPPDFCNYDLSRCLYLML